MRIALVCPYSMRHAGGVQQQVLAEANYLAIKGYQVLLAAPDVDSLNVTELNPFVSTLSLGRGVRIYGNGSLIPLSFPILQLAKIAAEIQQCDIVHFHEPFYPFTALLLRRLKTPAIATFHAARLRHPFYRCLRFLLRPLYAKLQARIAVSPLAAETVLNHFPSPVQIIPNGVSFSPRARSVKKINPPYLLFLGRNEKRKGLATLVAAFALLRGEFPQLRLKIAGSGSAHIKGDGIDNAGFISEAEKISLVAQAAAFCAPALYGESFGVILLEAMALGVPVIASRIRGYDTVLEDQKNGVMFEAGNAHALAKAISSLLRDKKLQAKIVRNGLETAKLHTWPRIGKEYLKIFTALSRRP